MSVLLKEIAYRRKLIETHQSDIALLETSISRMLAEEYSLPAGTRVLIKEHDSFHIGTREVEMEIKGIKPNGTAYGRQILKSGITSMRVRTFKVADMNAWRLKEPATNAR